MMDFHTLPEALKKQLSETERPLVEMMQEKVNYIKFCYNRPLSDKQVALIKKDEALIAAIENHITMLQWQLNFLMRENKNLNEFIIGMHEDNEKLQNKAFELMATMTAKKAEKW